MGRRRAHHDAGLQFPATNAIYQRFGGIDAPPISSVASAYRADRQQHRAGADPLRPAAAARIGYLKYTLRATWNVLRPLPRVHFQRPADLVTDSR
jgi:hypothetical protein